MSECYRDEETEEIDCSECPHRDECEAEHAAEQAERELEERCRCAGDCQCGAWQFINGRPVHVADCVCGAQ